MVGFVLLDGWFGRLAGRQVASSLPRYYTHFIMQIDSIVHYEDFVGGRLGLDF